MVGRTAHALSRLTLIDVIHPKQREALRVAFEKFLSGAGRTFQTQVWIGSVDKEDRRSLLIAQRTGRRSGRIQIRIADLSRVTDHGDDNELLDAIEHAAWEWRRTFDAVETPIVIVGGDGAITRINRAARMLVGRDYGEIVGRPLRMLPESEPWLSIGSLSADVQQRRSPAARQVKDAYGRTLDLLAMLFNADDPQDQHVIVVVWDVTALVDLQSRLEQQRTMATMGSLVAGVAHEVRNPLFAISATIDAMEQAAGGKLAEYFEVLREEIDRMTSLMQDLLAYGRPAAPVFAAVSVPEVIEVAIRASSALAARQGVTLVTTFHAAPDITADRDRLARALQNLIDNAVQHSASGSQVTVESRLSQHGHGRYAEIAVSDRGRGFAEADLPRLFEPFFSRRKGGTGLGLALVQQIVTEHGGTVAAANRDGGGAEVIISIPLPRAAGG